jgi:transglutaminase/protease-like cytokinesis protein 3
MKRTIIAISMILICLLWPVEVSAKTYTSKSEVYNLIKKNLVERKKEFTIEMNMDTMEEIGRNTDLFSAVTALDSKKTSKDGDYLKSNIKSWNTRWRWGGADNKATITLSTVYRTTLKQEKALGDKIASVLKSLDLEGSTDYEKVKAIHDYIIKRVSYDQTYQKYTAYNALINKSAVCQGYALAAYRLFTEAGIDCRIISGTAKGSAHAWNIVKVSGKWYNIDLTWDDPITSSGKQVLRYDYFLKSTDDFKDHKRDPEFKTKTFLKKYPIAKTSYEIVK